MSSSILGPEWNLSPDGINIVTENGTIKDAKTVLKKALNSDLKTIGKPGLPSELSKSKIGKIVLQIQKIRNISAPKAKEGSQAAPRMLKLTLTDGESYVQAIEITPINTISREKTAPGTKVLVTGANVGSGFLLISPQNFNVLGGQVDHLYDKWVLAKSVQQNHQYVSNDGAPPWVAFGGKIITGNQEKPFKSLEKDKDDITNSEFDQQRKDAIAEASTGAVRKTFGGRVKQNVQPVPNNQQYNRGRPNDRGDHDRGRKGKFGPRDEDVVEKLQKPSEKVSLFSFLEDKLPITEAKKPAVPSPSCNKNNCQNYHQKDPRIIQQKNEARQNGRQQYYDKSTSNSDTNKEKLSNQSSFNISASKPFKPEPKSSFAAKNLPQKSSSTNSDNPKISTSDPRNSFDSRSTANSVEDTTNSSSSRNYQPRYPKDQNVNGKDNFSQQQYQGAPNQYRGNNDRYAQQQQNQHRNISDRFSQHSPTSNNSAYPRDNFSQQPNQYRNSNDRYAQQQPYARDSYGPQQNRQQYSNYPQPSQKPLQNQPPGPPSAEMHQLANNLSKMSVSNEFASRSLRQHLNLGPPKRPEGQEGGSRPLTVGDSCLAKYWEDGKFYAAVIAAITDKTYAVQFKGYGNIEEVLKNDCFHAGDSYRNPNFNYQQNNFSGTSMEFRSRRGPPRN